VGHRAARARDGGGAERGGDRRSLRAARRRRSGRARLSLQAPRHLGADWSGLTPELKSAKVATPSCMGRRVAGLLRAVGRRRAVMLAGMACALAAVPAPATAKEPKPPPTVTLEWVGDIALSSQRGLPPGGLMAALAPVAHTLRDADITTGN